MKDSTIIGVDLGTSELKAGLFDRSGRLLDLARSGYPTTIDGTGRAEQDPEDWWRALIDSVRRLATRSTAPEAICVVGQGPTLVALDAIGRPVRAAVTWQDRRPDSFGSGYGLLPRLAWLAAEDPAAAHARWLLSAWDALALRLSGVAATSLQGHERPIAVDELIRVGIDPARVPESTPMGSVLAHLAADAAAQLGLPGSVRVIAGANDGTASILGAGLLEPGDAVDTDGASGGIAITVDSRNVPAGLPPGTYSAPAPVPGRWILGGAMAATGSALTWFADTVLGARWTMEELLAEAASVSSGADNPVFLPYLAGERAPIWDDAARGMFFGLTRAHGRGHFVRAVLEGAGFALRHVAEPIVAAGAPIRELRLTGWLARDPYWSQVRADITGLRVAIPEVEESAVLGAAILASAAVQDRDLAATIRAMTRLDRRYDPRSEIRPTYDRLFSTYVRLYPATRELL